MSTAWSATVGMLDWDIDASGCTLDVEGGRHSHLSPLHVQLRCTVRGVQLVIRPVMVIAFGLQPFTWGWRTPDGQLC